MEGDKVEKAEKAGKVKELLGYDIYPNDTESSTPCKYENVDDSSL